MVSRLPNGDFISNANQLPHGMLDIVVFNLGERQIFPRSSHSALKNSAQRMNGRFDEAALRRTHGR